MSEPKMKASSKNGLIEFEFDHNLLKMIEKELGNLKSESAFIKQSKTVRQQSKGIYNKIFKRSYYPCSANTRTNL